MRTVYLICLMVIGGFVFVQGTIWAADLCVDPGGGGGYLNLQDALDAASINTSDDTVMVVQGTYNGNFTYVSGSGKNITLEGGYTAGCNARQVDPGNTILDGGSGGRVLYISLTAGSHILIDGFTVRNGSSSGFGGGINASSSSPTAAGNITVSNSIVTANTSTANGGGVYAISQSTTAGGTAGTVTLSNNIVTSNSTTNQYASGGGIYARSYSQFGPAGTVIIRNNTVANNTVGTDASGGGVFASSYSVQGAPGTVTLTNNTIYNNAATTEGGGIYAGANSSVVSGGTLNCYNNIVRNNTCPTGADISLSSSGTDNRYGYNNNYSVLNGTWNGGSAGNIDVDPLFVSPGAGDFHLQAASPCIDAGDNSAPQLPATDFEGDSRVLDGDHNGTATVDMGVDEVVYLGSTFSWPMVLPAVTGHKK